MSDRNVCPTKDKKGDPYSRAALNHPTTNPCAKSHKFEGRANWGDNPKNGLRITSLRLRKYWAVDEMNFRP
jgi:hypothetical protein